jgi:hypothetical protein
MLVIQHGSAGSMYVQSLRVLQFNRPTRATSYDPAVSRGNRYVPGETEDWMVGNMEKAAVSQRPDRGRGPVMSTGSRAARISIF